MADEKQKTALAKREEKPQLTVGRTVGGLVPQDVDEMFRMATAIAKSGMAPKGLDRPEQVFVALQMGAEIGLAPMQAVQNIAVINGRPSVWGDAMLGIVEASGLLADFHEEAIEDAKGQVVGFRCTALRRGRSKPVVRTFTVDDAKRAGLSGKSGPWSQYPQRMLQMRARSWALRDGFPDALRGLVAREEAADCLETTATVVSAPDPFAPGRHSARPAPAPEPEPEAPPDDEEAPPDVSDSRADAVQEIEQFMLRADPEQTKSLTAAFKRLGVTAPGDADNEALDALLGTVRDLEAQ